MAGPGAAAKHAKKLFMLLKGASAKKWPARPPILLKGRRALKQQPSKKLLIEALEYIVAHGQSPT